MIPFHRVLIAAAIFFCAGFSMWSLGAWSATGRTLWLVLFAAFLVAAIALVTYLMNLRRILGHD
jgi:hypothetical protein